MDPSQRQQRLADLRQKLAVLTTEVVKTEDELVALESDGQLTLRATPAPTGRPPRTPAEKIALFLDLFGTRRSVYPKRWEYSNTGKTGDPQRPPNHQTVSGDLAAVVRIELPSFSQSCRMVTSNSADTVCRVVESPPDFPGIAGSRGRLFRRCLKNPVILPEKGDLPPSC